MQPGCPGNFLDGRAFLMGFEAKQSAATPQALRASSTRKGMATHAQLKLRFAVHLAGEPGKCCNIRRGAEEIC